MGVILFVMLCGRYPFEDPLQPRNMRKTMQRIMALSFDLPPSLSPNAADLINKMLSRAEVRIFVADIKAHPFLQPGFDQISADLGCAFKAKPIEAAVAEEIDVLLRHLQV